MKKLYTPGDLVKLTKQGQDAIPSLSLQHTELVFSTMRVSVVAELTNGQTVLDIEGLDLSWRIPVELVEHVEPKVRHGFIIDRKNQTQHGYVIWVHDEGMLEPLKDEKDSILHHPTQHAAEEALSRMIEQEESPSPYLYLILPAYWAKPLPLKTNEPSQKD